MRAGAWQIPSTVSTVPLMSLLKAKLPTGYHEQTYASPYWIVRWPHQKRIKVGVDSLLDAKPQRVLDYGAGDGRVLIEALRAGLEAETIVAYEPVDRFAQQLTDAAEKAGVADRITLVMDYDELSNYTFDVILCLSVLEHMPLPEREKFYRLCESSLSGEAVIDVPVEIGPTLAVKAIARQVLKGRDKEYTPSQLARIAVGGKVHDPERFDPSHTGTWIHNHKGFDYRLLRREMVGRFSLSRNRPTPLRYLPAPLGNQEVFFTARPR